MDKDVAKPTDKQAQTPNENLQQQTLNVYHVCKDGMVVIKPSDCWKTNLLPEMNINGLSRT